MSTLLQGADRDRRTALWIVLGLILTISAAYLDVRRNRFVTFDDSTHVYQNPVVLRGLSWESVEIALTTPNASLYIPLTTLSFMADVSLFGLSAQAMHVENLLWHLLATAALFLALRKLTGETWPSAMVAALFGLHPINVESVAWISERKNTLCAFFTFISLWCWSVYVRRPRLFPWAAATTSLALATLAKPMAVPFPVALLLLDAWPLNRWKSAGWRRLVLEKLPMFVISIAASCLALWAAGRRGIVSTADIPISARLTNAVVSTVEYLRDLVVPSQFAILYPHPFVARWGEAALAAALLVGILILSWKWRARCPWLLVGFAFFACFLAPSIGIVQIGWQARADRFTYVAQIGIWIAVVWTAAHCCPAGLQRWRAQLGGVWLCVLASLTVQQVPYWARSLKLYSHALAVTGPNPRILELKAFSHVRDNNDAEAADCWRASLAMNPKNPAGWTGLGAALDRLNDFQGAKAAFKEAAALDPKSPMLAYNVAYILDRAGESAAAKTSYLNVLRLAPDHVAAHYRLGLLFSAEGDFPSADRHFNTATRLQPGDPRLTRPDLGSVSQAQ